MLVLMFSSERSFTREVRLMLLTVSRKIEDEVNVDDAGDDALPAHE